MHSASSVLPILLGVAGIVLGIIACIVATSQKNANEALKSTVEDLKRSLSVLGDIRAVKDKLDKLEQFDRRLTELVTNKVDQKLGDILGIQTSASSSPFGSSIGQSKYPELIDRIAEHILELLSAGTGGLAIQIASTIGESVANKIEILPESIKEKAFEAAIPAIQKQLENEEWELDSDDWDAINKKVSELLPKWFDQEMANPDSKLLTQVKDRFITSIVDSDCSDVVSDNFDDIKTKLDSFLLSWFDSEFANPTSNLRAKIAEMFTDDIVSQGEGEIVPDNFDDIKDKLVESLTTWFDEEMKNPDSELKSKLKNALLDEVVNQAEESISEIVSEEWDDISDTVTKQLKKILDAELSDPNSELRVKLVTAMVDNIISTIEEN